MIIPKDLYNDIINYFKTKLSKQFEITPEADGLFGKEGTVIKIKDSVKGKFE